jgi:hypothetical protein
MACSRCFSAIREVIDDNRAREARQPDISGAKTVVRISISDNTGWRRPAAVPAASASTGGHDHE